MNSGLEVTNVEGIPSPSLLVWPDRVQANLDRMIELVGGDATRLRPHVKTHKMEAVVRMQLEAGIHMFKGATIAELEMCLSCGARDVLLAYPPVGPNQRRLVQLATKFPEADIQFVTDEPGAVVAMDSLCEEAGLALGVFIDFDCGMHRTGTGSVETAVQLAESVVGSGRLRFRGVHTYDGHVRDTSVAQRESVWSAAMDGVDRLVEAIEKAGLEVQAVVGGGSPTFGFHAAKRGWQCSPGTTLFWDGGYAAHFPDLPFAPAAAVLTRIISKPGSDRLCFDLGSKAIASENPVDRRVQLIGLEGARPLMASEEHFVFEFEETGRFEVGEAFLGIPYHICPTVALHQEAVLIRNGEATGETWPVTARNRKLTV